MAKRQFKVKFGWKLLAFVATVITLSWFFEGTREVQKGWTFEHGMVLAAGTALTLIMLGVQGYWIYIEEKVKGTLKKRIALYERIYSELQKRNGSDSGEES
jgi:hypothetical protein